MGSLPIQIMPAFEVYEKSEAYMKLPTLARF